MTSWAGTRYKSPEEAKAKCDGMFWYWQYRTHAYWLLEEVDGFNMEDWAWEHSDGGLNAKIQYFFSKVGINLSRMARLNTIRQAIS